MRSPTYRAGCVAAVALLCAGMLLPATLQGAAARSLAHHSARSHHPRATRDPRPTPPSLAALRAMHANELGQVPVIMIHRIVRSPSLPLDRTPGQLRALLDRLDRYDYVPVTANDFVTGHMYVPAGKHPVVLTFDDSSPSQLTLNGRGQPKPDTAIGVLLDFARHHPGFRPVATLYVIGIDPFQEGGRIAGAARHALRWLVAHGFEVGNHTMHHKDLGALPEAEVRQELATDQARLRRLAGVAPTTMAYPGGTPPRNHAVALSGSYHASRYSFRGAFLAGAGPAPSPYVESFPYAAIPRIRFQGKSGDCLQLCSAAWLDRLHRDPGLLYTSDGDPSHIAFPWTDRRVLDKQWAQRARPYRLTAKPTPRARSRSR